MEPLTDYVIDTVALVKHLEDDLPKGADRIFREAEAGRTHLYLPEIALGEFIYIALKGRLQAANPRIVAEEVVDQILATPYISLSGLTHTAWSAFLTIDIPELHDRMIVADALDRRLPLVTNDRSMQSVPSLKTVWR